MTTATVAPSAGPVTIRRGELRDVPAISRLLGVPDVADLTVSGLEPETVLTATRLLLAHAGLDQLWVGVRDGVIEAAVVLMPPAAPGELTALETALRLELGFTTALPDPTFAGVPEVHWALVPAATPAGVRLLPDLLAAALPAVDATGLPVVCIDLGAPGPDLDPAEFGPLPRVPGHPPMSLRPTPLTAASHPAAPLVTGTPLAVGTTLVPDTLEPAAPLAPA